LDKEVVLAAIDRSGFGTVFTRRNQAKRKAIPREKKTTSHIIF
jgi:hypothetical protein